MLSDGKISRPALAEIVFGDAERLKLLNSIIHPAVRSDFKEWLGRHEDFPFVIKEAAILFESGSYSECDAIITVVAPMDIRIQRVMNRDDSTIEDVVKRIDNQWTDEMRIAKSDFVITNTNLAETEIQISEILKKLQNI